MSLFWHTKAPKKRAPTFSLENKRNFFVFPACIQICGQLVRKDYPCILVKQSCLYIPRCVSNDVEKKGGFESTLLGFFVGWLGVRRERESPYPCWWWCISAAVAAAMPVSWLRASVAHSSTISPLRPVAPLFYFSLFLKTFSVEFRPSST